MKKTPTTQKELEHLDALIKQAGGMAKFGRSIGTNGPVIQQWVVRKNIPLGWRLALSKIKVKAVEK